MTFRHYILLLAESIGLHQIPVIRHATEIRYFLAEDAVHHQLISPLIRDIYRKNSCGHLDAIIDSALTMNLLRSMHTLLLSKNNTDICRLRLMNQLCEVSDNILSSEQKKAHKHTDTARVMEMAE